MTAIVTLRQMSAISKITMLEGARKHIFHVLMLFALTLIAISTLLGFFDHNVQIKIVKDLCLVAIMVSSGLIAITLSVSGVPSEIESKTVYPVMAKPMARWQFILGKYLGTMGTVAIGMGILLAAFAAILLAFAGHVDVGVLLVIPFLLLEAAILAAVALFLSTVSSTPLAWFLSIIVYVLGNIKFGMYSFITAHDQSIVGRFAAGVMYQALPNLECFNFKDSLVHGLPVPAEYLFQTAIYGILYTAFLLTLASLTFSRKEL